MTTISRRVLVLSPLVLSLASCAGTPSAPLAPSQQVQFLNHGNWQIAGDVPVFVVAGGI